MNCKNCENCKRASTINQEYATYYRLSAQEQKECMLCNTNLIKSRTKIVFHAWDDSGLEVDLLVKKEFYCADFEEKNQDTAFMVGRQFNVAFAYGDMSGLTDLEEQQFNDFVAKHEGTWVFPDDNETIYDLESCEITNQKADCIKILNVK